MNHRLQFVRAAIRRSEVVISPKHPVRRKPRYAFVLENGIDLFKLPLLGYTCTQEVREIKRKVLKNQMTQKDIDKIAKAVVSALLPTMATKTDIRDMVTQTDIREMVTKTDIRDMVTKTDIRDMATKTDIIGVRTDIAGLRTDIVEVRTDITGLKTDVGGVKTDIAGLSDLVIALNAKLDRRPPPPSPNQGPEG
jgi:hypothetical protein